MAEIQKVKKEIEVPKEASELGDAIGSLVKSCIEHGKDGFQASDVPAIVLENLAKLNGALQDLNKLPDEAKADPGKMAVVLALALDEVI